MTTSQAMPDRSTVATIDGERLRTFAEQVFERCGLPAADAEILSDHLVWADLRGISWLGAQKIPEYVARLCAGVTLAPVGDPHIHYQHSGFLVVHAEDTFGQVIGYRVMKQVIETARTTGVSAALVLNTTCPGALGYYTTLAVEERMIGLAINNCSPLQTAPGGEEPTMGSQALAVASPAGRNAPLILDTATSSVSPTVDLVDALDGILLPMGGHRGFGLARLWEVLTGVLAASSTISTDVGRPGGTRPRGVSTLLLAVDPTTSMPYETFTARVDDLIDRIHGSRRADGADRIRIAGEQDVQTMAGRHTEGIPMSADLRVELRAIAVELGVPAL